MMFELVEDSLGLKATELIILNCLIKIYSEGVDSWATLRSFSTDMLGKG